MNELAQQIAAETWDDHTPQLDPVTIAIIVQLLAALFEYFQDNCDLDAAALQLRAREGRFRDRVFVRLLLRRQLGRRGYQDMTGDRLADAMVVVARDEDNQATLAAAMDTGE